jgi:zinc protease
VLRGVGNLAVSTAVQADATGAALREALEQLSAMRGQQLSTEDVYRARASAVWATLGAFRTIDGLGRAAASLFFLRQRVDGYHQRVARIQALERDAVEAALYRYLDPDDMHVVLVGDPALINRQVAPLRLGPIELFTPDGRPYE